MVEITLFGLGLFLTLVGLFYCESRLIFTSTASTDNQFQCNICNDSGNVYIFRDDIYGTNMNTETCMCQF